MYKRFALIFFLLLILLPFVFLKSQPPVREEKVTVEKESYWFMLHRKSNKEYLYKGKAGDIHNSQLVRTFQVKTGVPGKSPTPLPKLLGKDYWIITNKQSSIDNPETAPYFIALDIPSGSEWPYGPVPYNECDGQCDWVLPGYFGLHGTGGNSSKLSKEDPGSSGCIRHSDSDITYLYNILTPEKEEIRYYIEDI